MAIAGSGTVSFSDLRTEFVGGSSAISFNDLYRGGSNIKAKAGDNLSTNLAASVPANGTIDIADFYSTSKGFKFTVDSNTTNFEVDSAFGDDYDLNYPKIVDIDSGVTIGGNADEAIDIPSGLASTLTINNSGIVIGFGGASASAAGGHAIACATANVTINNTGQISGGGGAGGAGGAGGNGETEGSREPAANWTNGSAQLGHYWNVNTYHFYYNGSTSYIYWGSNIGSASGFPSYVTIGSNRYYRGIHRTTNKYEIYRQYMNSTSGGTGGAFGNGAGYNQSATAGGTGAAGGTAAGTGGNGGAGGALATAGTAGSTGANGGITNGAAGGTAGAAGAAVSGTSVTMNNTGTINGAVA